MSSWRSDLSLLAERRFAILFTARTVSMLGTAFAPVALAFGVLRLPGFGTEAEAQTALSIVLACEAVPMVVFFLIGGVIADRFQRYRVLLAAQILAATAYAALAVMLATGHSAVFELGLAAALSGIGTAITYPTLTGIIPEVVPADRLHTGNSLLSFGASAARIAGVVAGGAVVATLGGPWAMAMCAGMFTLASVIVPGLRGTGTSASGALTARSMFTDLRGGWREFVSHEWLWVIVVQWSFLIFCFSAAHSVLGPIIAEQTLGGARPWSYFLAAEAVGEVLGVVIAMRWTPRRPILAPVLLTAIFVPIPYLLLGIGAPLWASIASAVPMGLTFMLFGVLWNTTMQREVPREALSRVSSYDALGSFMFGPLGLLLAGPASVHWGAGPAMVVCALAMAVIGVAVLPSHDVRTLAWRDPAPDEPAVPATPDVFE